MITKKIDILPVVQFIMTEASDVMSLPTEGISPGSTAIYVHGGIVYMFTGSAGWIEIGGDA